MTRGLLVAFALSLSGCSGGCSPFPGPPSADSCSGEDTSGDVATLAIGPPGEGTFVPFRDGDRATLVSGGQGATMLPLRLAVTGARPPACLAQATTLVDDRGVMVLSDDLPLRAYADGAGRSTRTHYLVIGSTISATIAVASTVNGRSAKLRLSLRDGAGPDLGPPTDLAPAD